MLSVNGDRFRGAQMTQVVLAAAETWCCVLVFVLASLLYQQAHINTLILHNHTTPHHTTPPYTQHRHAMPRQQRSNVTTPKF